LVAQHPWKNRRGDSLELDTLATLVLPDPKRDKKPNSARRLVGRKTMPVVRARPATSTVDVMFDAKVIRLRSLTR
jgi:hypothetical protein